MCEKRRRKDHPPRPVPSVSPSREIFVTSGCAPAPEVTAGHMPGTLLHSGIQDQIWPQINVIPTGSHSPHSAPTTACQPSLQAWPPPGRPPLPPFPSIKTLSVLLSSTRMPPEAFLLNGCHPATQILRTACPFGRLLVCLALLHRHSSKTKHLLRVDKCTWHCVQ